VIITTGTRPAFFLQTIQSLIKNAVDPKAHHLTYVYDLPIGYDECQIFHGDTTIQLEAQGASAARNTGVGSIPNYRRRKHVMFLDDDVYMCPGWDRMLGAIMDCLPYTAVSGHAHPFNREEPGSYQVTGSQFRFKATSVLSTVNIAMPWSVWDKVGYFTEPGGPGGSEDVDWCKRATDKGYGLAVTDPQCVIHCGLTSSSGKQIVGYDLMTKQNGELIGLYGLAGKVQQA
jgi:hypothetical protein